MANNYLSNLSNGSPKEKPQSHKSNKTFSKKACMGKNSKNVINNKINNNNFEQNNWDKENINKSNFKKKSKPSKFLMRDSRNVFREIRQNGYLTDYTVKKTIEDDGNQSLVYSKQTQYQNLSFFNNDQLESSQNNIIDPILENKEDFGVISQDIHQKSPESQSLLEASMINDKIFTKSNHEQSSLKIENNKQEDTLERMIEHGKRYMYLIVRL